MLGIPSAPFPAKRKRSGHDGRVERNALPENVLLFAWNGVTRCAVAFGMARLIRVHSLGSCQQHIAIEQQRQAWPSSGSHLYAVWEVTSAVQLLEPTELEEGAFPRVKSFELVRQTAKMKVILQELRQAQATLRKAMKLPRDVAVSVAAGRAQWVVTPHHYVADLGGLCRHREELPHRHYSPGDVAIADAGGFAEPA